MVEAAHDQLASARGQAHCAAVLLLAGGIRPSALGYTAGCSVLDLEIRPGMSLSRYWLDLWNAVGHDWPEGTPIRFLVSGNMPAPSPEQGLGRWSASIERDKRDYAGPAGAVRDAISELPDEAHVVVHDAAAYPACEIGPVIAEHFASGAGATVAVNPDSSAAGFYVFRCGLMRDVSRVGFTDLKEQFLNRLVERGTSVRVARLSGRGFLPLRTRRDFLNAAHLAGGGRARAATALSPVVTKADAGMVDSIVSQGAAIGEGACVVDSVVMSGATVGEGAIVARSVVCPGGVVGAGERVVDAVVSRDGVRTDGWADAHVRWRKKQ